MYFSCVMAHASLLIAMFCIASFWEKFSNEMGWVKAYLEWSLKSRELKTRQTVISGRTSIQLCLWTFKSLLITHVVPWAAFNDKNVMEFWHFGKMLLYSIGCYWLWSLYTLQNKSREPRTSKEPCAAFLFTVREHDIIGPVHAHFLQLQFKSLKLTNYWFFSSLFLYVLFLFSRVSTFLKGKEWRKKIS